MKDALFTLGMAAPLVGLLGFVVLDATAMPDVHVSYSTGECVKVVNYTDEQFDCSNYPSKFNHVWVQ